MKPAVVHRDLKPAKPRREIVVVARPVNDSRREDRLVDLLIELLDGQGHSGRER